MDIQHRTRRTQWSVTYSEAPRQTRQVFFDQQVFPLLDSFGDPVVDTDTGETVLLQVDVPSQTDEVFIDKQLNAVFRYLSPRHVLEINAQSGSREYQLSGDQEENDSGSVSWQWQLSRRNRSALSVGFSKNNRRSGQNDDFAYLNFSFVRSLTRNTEATLTGRYALRETDRFGGDYKEIRVAVTLHRVF